jgi:hypothetical protein
MLCSARKSAADFKRAIAEAAEKKLQKAAKVEADSVHSLTVGIFINGPLARIISNAERGLEMTKQLLEKCEDCLWWIALCFFRCLMLELEILHGRQALKPLMKFYNETEIESSISTQLKDTNTSFDVHETKNLHTIEEVKALKGKIEAIIIPQKMIFRNQQSQVASLERILNYLSTKDCLRRLRAAREAQRELFLSTSTISSSHNTWNFDFLEANGFDGNDLTSSVGVVLESKHEVEI